MAETLVCAVTESSEIGEARRRSVQYAKRLGFDDTAQGKLALIVTELGTNAVRHAHDGQMLITSKDGDSGPVVEVLALDKRPGMSSLDQCLQDGYSSAGTKGAGLGAIARLADEFDVFTSLGTGTAIVARLGSGGSSSSFSRPAALTVSAFTVGAAAVPYPGEEVNGDGYAIFSSETSSLVMVVDGLGHGLMASEASREAIRLFESNPTAPPTELIEIMHRGMRATRGAAVAIAMLDKTTREIRYAGVGNIAGSILSAEKTQSMVSLNGIVGHQMRKVQQFTYAWPEGSLLVMHSDGLASQWRLDRYAGLIHRDPTLVAGVLYRDFTRGRDDVTVVAVREAFAGGTRSA